MHRTIQKSFRAAGNGIIIAFREERSFQLMIVAGLLAIALMALLPLSHTEEAVVWIMIFSILTLELINSVMERMLDLMYRDHNEKVGAIKDLMAGIVLMVSLGSLVIGWLIFYPKIIALL